MNPAEIEAIETDLLLEALHRRWGYDFRSYARASITRRLRQLLERGSRPSLSSLIPDLLYDSALLAELLDALSVTVSDMFRDPPFWQLLRREVAPLLRTYPFIRIWSAGCATGQEAYSLAILLKEEGLLAQSTIYATDISESALAAAKEGIYPLKEVREQTENYQQSGGHDSFSRYYHAAHERMVMRRELRERITFARHNLVSDHVFAEMHLVLCRNVMIYFNQELKERVLGLLDSSLIRGGFLCLGARETLRSFPGSGRYDTVDASSRIFRKRVWPELE
jgi:chemotaxis protein methyltransferase CheR